MSDVFILGAGFAKAIHSEMPTLEELSDEVINRLQSLSFPIPAPLNEMDRNIELWITYLSQRQPWLTEYENDYNRSIAGRIRRQIFEVIDERTSLASNSKAPDWLVDLIKSWHNKQATIISLNYDTLIERTAKNVAITDNVKQILAVQMYPSYFANVQARSGVGLWGEGKLETFSFLKLHGSINWYYSGRDDFFGETILYSEDLPLGHEVWVEKHFRRPQSKDKEPLIIPPVLEKTTYFNNETVRTLWHEAGFALANASRVFIIGYSLPTSDLGMTFFLKKHSPIGSTSVYLVDIDQDLKDHYRRLLNWDFNAKFVQNQNPVEGFVNNYARLA